jgi:hypothetical protein
VLAEEHLTIAGDLLQEAKDNNDGSDEGDAWVRSAQDEKNAAQSARAKGNDFYQKMLRKHSKDPESFHNKLETICRDLNIVRECYHGGKYNGVNCIKIMKENEQIFEKASATLIEMKSNSLTEDEVNQKCCRYSGLDCEVIPNVRKHSMK